MKIFKSLKNQAISFLEQYKQGNPATYAAAEQAVGAVLITDGLVGIDSPFGENKRPGIFGTLGVIAFGLLFMFVPKFVGNFTNLNKMTATTSATVVTVGMPSTTSDSSTCSLRVSYVVDGEKYLKQSSMSSSSYCSLNEGQVVNINYDPTNPALWAYQVNTINSFLYFFFFAGLFVVLSGIVTFVIRLLSIIFGWKLLQDGRKNAASLPADTNLQTIIAEVKKSFTANIFNFGGNLNITSNLDTLVPQPPLNQAPQVSNPESPETETDQNQNNL